MGTVEGTPIRAVVRRWRHAVRRPWPVHPVLFGAYFVLFLLSQNLGEATFAEALPWLVVAALGSAVVAVVTAFVFGEARRGALVASAIVIGFFAYNHVVQAAQPLRLPGLVHPVGWLMVGALAVVLALRLRERLGGVNRALDIVAVALVGVTLASIIPYELARTRVGAAGPGSAPPPGVGVPGERPDIYYLIFDRHGSDATLRREFGIESGLTPWLTAHGFVVLDHSYANYLKTHLSLASSLNMRYLDDLTARVGTASDDIGPLIELLQDNQVGRFVQARGYRYIHTGSGYGPTRVSRIADENPRQSDGSDFAKALYDTTVLPGLVRRIGLKTTDRDRTYQEQRWQWGALTAIRDQPGPKFVFSHFLLPHPPYVFEPDGSYVELATARARGEPENYRRQMEYAHRQLEAFLTPLVERPPGERPIVIIQADEGPFPRRFDREGKAFDWTGATDAEIEMKYGILNAMLLPGEGATPDRAMTPVNSFRFVFERYFAADLPMLPDRVFVSRTSGRLYDFLEITDRLAFAAELDSGVQAGTD